MTIKNKTSKAGSSIQEFEKNLTFGEYVRLLLKADDITQEELANKMNCSKQYINRILLGKDSVTLETAQKISHALGYSLAPFAEVLLNEQMKKIDPQYIVEITKKAG
jgi:transcriptional regulator with XRE-family HTH domain